MQSMYYVGLDVHKKTISYCVKDASGRIQSEGTIPPYQAAQIVQDFGAGALLLWPLLRYGKGIDESWDNAPTFRVFVTGAFLFGLGWLIRRLTTPPQP